MDFMNKITKLSKKATEAAVDTYKIVSDKTGEIVKETKSKFSISDKTDDINEIYLSIGKTVYEMYINGEEVGNVFSKECRKIEKMEKEILEIKKEILYNKGLRTCDNCSENISLDSKFCEHCGTKQKKVKIKEEKDESKDTEKEVIVDRVCPECGTVMDIKAGFCKKCGHKF